MTGLTHTSIFSREMGGIGISLGALRIEPDNGHGRAHPGRSALCRRPHGEAWILRPPDTIIGAQIASAFRAAGIDPPRPQIEIFSVPLCYRLIATGRFVTMLPASMVSLGGHLSLRFLRVASPVVARPTGIMSLRNRTRSSPAELFIGEARKLARCMAPSPRALVRSAPALSRATMGKSLTRSGRPSRRCTVRCRATAPSLPPT